MGVSVLSWTPTYPAVMISPWQLVLKAIISGYPPFRSLLCMIQVMNPQCFLKGVLTKPGRCFVPVGFFCHEYSYIKCCFLIIQQIADSCFRIFQSSICKHVHLKFAYGVQELYMHISQKAVHIHPCSSPFGHPIQPWNSHRIPRRYSDDIYSYQMTLGSLIYQYMYDIYIYIYIYRHTYIYTYHLFPIFVSARQVHYMHDRISVIS